MLNQNAKREQGKTAQKANITAAKAVSDIVRTTLGPKSMLKMLLDPMGGIVLTNDGNAILREVSQQFRVELNRSRSRNYSLQILKIPEKTLTCFTLFRLTSLTPLLNL